MRNIPVASIAASTPSAPTAFLVLLLMLVPNLSGCGQRVELPDAVRVLIAQEGEWVPYLYSSKGSILRYTEGFTGRLLGTMKQEQTAAMGQLRLVYYQKGRVVRTVDCFTSPEQAPAFAIWRNGTESTRFRLRPEALAFHIRAQNELNTKTASP
jgi:hypothetical protein